MSQPPDSQSLGAQRTDALPAGTRIGDYEVLKVLGQGGFGITYEGRHVTLGRMVAIKEFFIKGYSRRTVDGSVVATGAMDESGVPEELRARLFERFLSEARKVATKFHHPNVVKGENFFAANGAAYFVMELIDGQPFDKWLKSFETSGRQPSEEEIRPILEQVLDAVDYIHGLDEIHRDLKPHNIMIRSNGTPVLIDFGSARTGIGRGNHTSIVMATDGYSPPEQLADDGLSQLGRYTDIYSLGAIFYRVVSGQAPTDSLKRTSGLRRGRTDGDPYKPARDAAREPMFYSDRFLTAIDRCLDLDEMQRPGTVAELRASLGWMGAAALAAASAPTQIVRLNRDGRKPDGASKWKVWGLLGSAGAAAAALAVGAMVMLKPPASGPATPIPAETFATDCANDAKSISQLQAARAVDGLRSLAEASHCPQTQAMVASVVAKIREEDAAKAAADEKRRLEEANRLAEEQRRAKEAEAARLAAAQKAEACRVETANIDRLVAAKSRADLVNLRATVSCDGSLDRIAQAVSALEAAEAEASRQAIAAAVAARCRSETETVAALVKAGDRTGLVSAQRSGPCPEAVQAIATGLATLDARDAEAARVAEAQRAEAARIAEAKRLEAARQAEAEAEAMKAAVKAAADRKAEEERLARQKAEAEKAEQDRLAREQADRTAEAQRQKSAALQACMSELVKGSVNNDVNVIAALIARPDCHDMRDAAEAMLSRIVTEREKQSAAVVADATPPPATPPSAVPPPVTLESVPVSELKKELRRLGCYSGPIDEDWSSEETRRAIGDYRKYASVTRALDQPDLDLLRAMRSQENRVCPLSCAPRETAVDGHCVAKTCPSGEHLTIAGRCIANPEKPADHAKPPKPPAKAAETPKPKTAGKCFTAFGRTYCE